MTESNARNVVDRYFTAWTSKDFITARTLLHDDLSFKGPSATFDTADAYMRGIKHAAAGVTGVERRIVFVEGDDVCQVYDLVIATPAITVPVAEWLQVRGNRIAMIQIFFDTSPFAHPPAS